MSTITATYLMAREAGFNVLTSAAVALGILEPAMIPVRSTQENAKWQQDTQKRTGRHSW